MHHIRPRRDLQLNVLSANPPSVNGQVKNVKGVKQGDLNAQRLRRRPKGVLMC